MSKKVKILFRTAGGKAKTTELGTGHIYRCMNLAKSMKFSDNYFLIEDFGGGKEILLEKGFDKIKSIKPKSTLKSEFQKIEKIVQEENIDLVIFDRFKAKNSILKKIKKITKLVVISDLKKIDFDADLVVNGFIGFENMITRNKYGTKCLLGPAYQILGNEYSKKPLTKKSNGLLATFGGYDENNVSELFLKEFINFDGKMKLKIVLGPASKFLKKYKNIENEFPKTIKIIKKTNSLNKLISESKFGICSGGITSYEFASRNTPFGIICQHRHQKITAKAWEDKYKVLNLGMPNGKISDKIQSFLKDVEDGKISFGSKLRKVVDGNGTKRIALEIRNMTKNHN